MMYNSRESRQKRLLACR